jgi:uncharacterized DUF497 family protein
MTMVFRWDPQKNALLMRERGLSFEQIALAVEGGDLLQVIEHPNAAKYPNQKIMIVAMDGYAFLVPFVQEVDGYFLKTIIPSRKATRDFMGAQE